MYFRLTGGAGKSQNYKGRAIYSGAFLLIRTPRLGDSFLQPRDSTKPRAIFTPRALAPLHYVSCPRSDRISLIQPAVLYFFYVTQHEWIIFMLGGREGEEEEEEERDACTDTDSPA